MFIRYLSASRLFQRWSSQHCSQLSPTKPSWGWFIGSSMRTNKTPPNLDTMEVDSAKSQCTMLAILHTPLYYLTTGLINACALNILEAEVPSTWQHFLWLFLLQMLPLVIIYQGQFCSWLPVVCRHSRKQQDGTTKQDQILPLSVYHLELSSPTA